MITLPPLLDPPEVTLWADTTPPGVKGTVTLDRAPWPAVHGDDGHIWVNAAWGVTAGRAMWHTVSAYSTIGSFKADR